MCRRVHVADQLISHRCECSWTASSQCLPLVGVEVILSRGQVQLAEDGERFPPKLQWLWVLSSLWTFSILPHNPIPLFQVERFVKVEFLIFFPYLQILAHFITQWNYFIVPLAYTSLENNTQLWQNPQGPSSCDSRGVIPYGSQNLCCARCCPCPGDRVWNHWNLGLQDNQTVPGKEGMEKGNHTGAWSTMA